MDLSSNWERARFRDGLYGLAPIALDRAHAKARGVEREIIEQVAEARRIELTNGPKRSDWQEA